MRDKLNIRKRTPKPNQFYYKMFFAMGFIRYPKRALNLIRSKLSNFSPNINYYPIIMDIEPTQRCNYKCVMCIRFAEKRKDMTFEEFKRIIDEQFGLIEVKIQGAGEPLLNNDFFKMVDYAMEKRLWVRTTTNGSLLHLNDNHRKLVDSKIHDINISIDGATKDVYEAIRRGGNYERTKENSRLINDYNNRVKKTTVRAWVVLQKRNQHQFFDFPQFFASLGFREMCYSFALHNYGREGNNPQMAVSNYSNKEFRKLFQICDKAGIKPVFFFHPHFDSTRFCRIPFERVYITTDSHILPCCYIANPKVVDFGNYNNFEEIWFNKYVKFRSNLKKDDTVPHFCKQCYGGNQ